MVDTITLKANLIEDCFPNPHLLLRQGPYPYHHVKFEPMVINTDTTPTQKFQELDVFCAIRDVIHERKKEWESTDFFGRVMDEILAGKVKWRCQNKEQFKIRCKRLEGLYNSIKVKGFRIPRSGDTIKVFIDEKGHFQFVDGRHRLSMAQLLDIEVPVQVVGFHYQWVLFRDQILKYAKNRKMRAIYQRIDHPDLCNIPYVHGVERLSMLKSALEGYPVNGKSLLDIGSHWGAMSQEFERMGFKVTAVEKEPRALYFMKRIREATRSSYRIIEGNIFSVDPGQYDILLALNVFHHFLKQEKTFIQLKNFLSKSHSELIIFQAHSNNPPGQMRNAYWNPPPSEFAKFVSDCSNLRFVQSLGETPDGRVIFLIHKGTTMPQGG